MEYKIVNKKKFEINTVVFNETMMEEVSTEGIKDIVNNDAVEKVTLYEANSNIDYNEAYKIGMEHVDTLFDITYINSYGYMISVEGLNIIQLTIRLNELEKNNDIEADFLNIFNCKDGRLLKGGVTK